MQYLFVNNLNVNDGEQSHHNRFIIFYLISYDISILMIFNPLLLAVCALQFFTLTTQLVPNRQSTIIHQPIGMEISQNERYLMAYNSTHFGIYNTIFGSQVGIVSSALGVKVAVLSGDGNKISICNNENEVITYNISTMTNEETIQKQSVFNIREHKLKQQKTSNVVVDLCYTAENEHLIIAYEDGVIISLTNDIVTATSINNAIPSRLACGVGSDFGIFTVAAFTLVDQIAFVKMFIVLNDTKEIDQLKINFEAVGLSSLYSIDMASNPTSIYLSGNSDQIISYAAPSFERRVYYKSVGNDQFKFRISNSGFFASANATHITVGNLQQTSAYSAQFQYFESDTKTFGLAADGVRFSYIGTNGKTIFTSECNEGQYYNTDEKTCKICSSQCSLCTKNQTTCFQCRSGNYIQKNKCLKCKSNCMECSSASNCEKCAEQFVLNDQQCGCKNGYILREDACQRGIQFWVFAAIVGGASFLLCLFAVICVIRSRSIEESKNRLIEQPIQHS